MQLIQHPPGALGYPLLLFFANFIFNPAALAQQISFETDIAPILEERCWYCHGEDEQESGLRLDRRRQMLRGGDSGIAAIVPGRPEKSYLIDVINHSDPNVEMPPDDDKLPQEEIALLSRWIEQGAKWPGQMQELETEKSDHWSFQPVRRPVVPKNNKTSTSPIDAFVQQRLSENKLAFSESADPRSLLRRLSIVLTGLPPTDSELADFLISFQQDSAAAYLQAVERLLDSPHFGERWAQHWLDVIRWAETNGSEANLYRKNAWIYRDYVVRAFNEDLPYNLFVQQQIAGDTMGTGDATGFLVAGPHVPAATVGREPTAIRQARADRMDEIMQTVGASIMGVTIGCARCHNHKFDPITIKDYYAMTSVFQDIEFGSRHPEFSTDHPRRQRGEDLWKQIANHRSKLRSLGGWEENWGAYRELHFRPARTKAIRVQFKTPNVSLDEFEVFGTADRKVNLAHRRRGTKVSGFPEKGNDTRNPIDRVNDGQYGTMAWRAKVPKDSEQRPWLQLDFSEPMQIERVRLSSNREYFYDTDYLQQKPYLPRYEFDIIILKEDGTWQPWVGTWFVNKKLNEKHPDRSKTLIKIQELIGSLSEEGPRPSFIGRKIPPAETFVLLRGSPESPRDEVSAAGPAIFGGELGLSNDAPGDQRRAAFAQWITDPEHPLTARVMANRLWHHVFGSGLVPTTSDFGKAGATASHPELLDWLAAEFVEPTVGVEDQGDAEGSPSPWSMKHMIRLMVLSHAFRQSSQPNEKAQAVDAGSRLLWRFPPKRVEAEVIRDSILQASGSLNLTVGGRSYRIHNEKKTYAQWEVLDNHGPQTWRRMLYQERMRRVDDQMFMAFDFPDCGQVRPRRPVSTTPLQALNLMNSPFVMQQAERIVQRVQKEDHAKLADQVERCFQLLLGRAADPAEINDCTELADEFGLAMVCRALINSNEFAFLP